MSDPNPQPKDQPLTCGIVMPISAIDGLAEPHWAEVKLFISETVATVGFSARLVSDAADVGVIHKRIVQNLYADPIVVCDVSARNPNVMCELGMRLAFDKPTVIIKDDKTPRSFDTENIEHLEYPRDLRFGKMVAFKELLAKKVKDTHDAATKDPNFSTFLKHFGTFKVAKMDTEVVTKEDLILEELAEIRKQLRRPRTLPPSKSRDINDATEQAALRGLFDLYSKRTGNSAASHKELRSFFESLAESERQQFCQTLAVPKAFVYGLLDRLCQAYAFEAVGQSANTTTLSS
jgi:hypothetical protein